MYIVYISVSIGIIVFQRYMFNRMFYGFLKQFFGMAVITTLVVTSIILPVMMAGERPKYIADKLQTTIGNIRIKIADATLCSIV